MNFFESQDTAKRNTKKLIVLFALAVLSLVLVTNLLVMAVFGYANSRNPDSASGIPLQFDPAIFLLVGALVSGVILLGSLYKMAALSGGGARIAEMMNGRLLLAGSDDLHERRVLNVVEEMAIASGTPVPPVYLLEEAGINAFAAGYSPADAVIGVTRGTIETLSREQLQGVIAHEFSHILHGDMRINIRLIGILHGIMVLGIIGYHLMRGGAYSRRSKDSGGIVMLGLGLVVIGFVGTFFGNLIKAAVSRQREFLADASAVQFTRNPDGIAGALMQIARHSERSYLRNPNAAEISHALFEEGSHSALSALYATHPPLEKRIAAILPQWDGSYELVEAQTSRSSATPEPSAQERAAAQRARAETLLSGTAGVLIMDSMIDQVGNPGAQHLAQADHLLAAMPAQLHAAAQHPAGARALVYLLVLDQESQMRQAQLQFLQGSADKGVFAELQHLSKTATTVEAELRLPLLSIALSSLRQLSKPQYQLFKTNFETVIGMDGKVNLFEWSLQKILFQHLAQVFEPRRASRSGHKDLAQLTAASTLLLSLIAHSGKQENISTEEAFDQGATLLKLDTQLLPLAEISMAKLDLAAAALRTLKPLQKPALLKACAASIMADRKVMPIEAELLRAIAAIIDCPMPPLVV
ncbi:MAG: M48 family metallopeptidase [Pseudomonadales bacterium]|nr:M48 family metallopeptidase [Pseudomonadales bacterium]